jgi:hypothetical protein
MSSGVLQVPVTEVFCKKDEAHAQQVIYSSQRGADSSKK